jgi:hypothetical protein
MGLVAHTTAEASFPIPNSGVWVLRRHRYIQQFLESVWNTTKYINHKWWENAAVLELLGYDLSGGTLKIGKPTRITKHTRFLPLEWNSIPQCPASNPRIVHFPAVSVNVRQALLAAAVKDRVQRSANADHD